MKTSRIFLVSWLLALAGGGCLATAPINPQAAEHNLAGARALARGELHRAEVCLRLSLEYNPCFADALHNLALVELARGRLELAERREREALECRPELVQAVNGLGVVNWKRGRIELARDFFQRALKMDPGYLDARRNLVVVALESGDPATARRQLERLRLLAPHDEWVERVASLLVTRRPLAGDRKGERKGEGR